MHYLSTQHTVIPVCEIIQVDTVNVGDENTLRRVSVSLRPSLEAITVDVVAAAMWESRCGAVSLGVSSLGQVRIFKRRVGYNR